MANRLKDTVKQNPTATALVGLLSTALTGAVVTGQLDQTPVEAPADPRVAELEARLDHLDDEVARLILAHPIPEAKANWFGH